MREEPPSRWREPNRGTAIKETERGLTYLEFSSWRITALRPSPAAAWVKQEGEGRWRGTAMPDISLGELIRQIRAERSLLNGASRADLPPDERPPARPYETRRRQSFARFLEHVPGEVQDELAERYPRRDWQLFRLLLASPEAREACALGDRALVFALTEARWLLRWPALNRVAFARRWLRHPRRKALARLGFPDRPLSVTVLRKLLLAHADGEVLWALRRALCFDECQKVLAHIPRVNAAVALLVQPELLERISPKLLESQALLEDRWEAVNAHRLLEDTLQLEAQLDVGKRPRFSSLEALRERHDELAAIARQGALACDIPFPPPPVQLNEDEQRWILPLSNGRELVNEGMSMRHCLGSLEEHHRLAREGRFYAWALLGEDRATVALERHGDRWVLHDARGPANMQPSEEVMRWARGLLRRANASVLVRKSGQRSLFDDLAPQA